MIMESLFGVVDVFWVAHLGADAITTVGLDRDRPNRIFVIALGLSMGATAMVARRIGEKDEAAAGLVRCRPSWWAWWFRDIRRHWIFLCGGPASADGRDGERCEAGTATRA